jgi:uncharacterized protein
LTTLPSAVRRPAVLLDTGVLVALYLRDDPWHAAAERWMAGYKGTLYTVEPVLTEVAFFLPTRLRAALAELACTGVLQIIHLDACAYARMAALLLKYADHQPDWADMALVWVAEETGIHRIATLDVKDFGVYRIGGRKRFELALLA